MITITQVSFFRIFTIAPHFHSSRTFTVCQTMFTIFVSSSTIASPPHFNSSAEIKSKPAALKFSGALNPSYIPSLEISFIEILVLFILSSKSCTMVGIGSGLHWNVRSILFRKTIWSCSEKRVAPTLFFTGIEVFILDPVMSLTVFKETQHRFLQDHVLLIGNWFQSTVFCHIYSYSSQFYYDHCAFF